MTLTLYRQLYHYEIWFSNFLVCSKSIKETGTLRCGIDYRVRYVVFSGFYRQ